MTVDLHLDKLVRRRCWQELTRAVETFSQQLKVPWNVLLAGYMGRSMMLFLLQHPEAAPQVLKDLDSAERELVESDDYGRVCTLAEMVGNLKLASEKYGPTVH